MLAPETPLGPYRLVAKIGAGGMGEVWKAEDTRLGRMVAIKILPPAVASDGDALARLKREARTAAQLYHPNIATIHSIEQDGDRFFIVMELVDGEPLSHVMRRGAMNEIELCRIARGVADALAEAHAKGIVHRDIKPDNVIVSGSRVKVLDFGIAKQVGAVGAQSSLDGTTDFMTQRGMIIGTVHYMSPEQALGKPLDARTDIFSLGVLMYQAATGQLPFRGETVTETITQIVRDEPTDPRAVNATLSPWLSEIIRRCMQKKPDDRFATAAELVSALDAGLSAAPTVVTGAKKVEPKRRTWIPVLLMLAIAIIAAIGVTRTMRKPAVVAPPPAPVVKTQTAATSTTSVNVVAPAPLPVPAPVAPPTTATAPAPAPKIVEAPPLEAPPPQPNRYELAMQQLRAGDWMLARDSFLDIVRTEPHNAPAHLHLGEIFLITHNVVAAQTHFERALEDGSTLDARERQLAQIGLAISTGQRVAARERVREFLRTWPNDPAIRAYERATREEGGPPRPLRGGRRGWKP